MKAVRLAELKARLSAHLRSVRKGRTLTAVDRDTSVALIVPSSADFLEVRRATRRLCDLAPPPAPLVATDSLAILLDGRHYR